MRFRFPAASTEGVRSLAASEQACCAFLRFDLVGTDTSLVLTVESDPAGQDARRFIFAQPLPEPFGRSREPDGGGC